MKKNKKLIIFSILSVVIVLILLKMYLSSSSDILETENVKADAVAQPPKPEVFSEPAKTSSNEKPDVIVKQQDKTAPLSKKSEFSVDELKEIEKLRSTAKMTLAANYTAQMAFFVEYGRYTTDLKSIGYTPYPSEMTYKLGFVRQFQPEEESQGSNEDFTSIKNLTTDTFIGEKEGQSNRTFKYASGVDKINLDEYSRYCERGCTANDREFEILLVFPLPNSNKVDVWVVNEKKEIIQVLDGTK